MQALIRHLQPQSTTGMMWITLLAMLPSVFAMGFIYGTDFYSRLILTLATTSLFEALCFFLRFRSWNALKDGSALITAFILAVSLPPIAPWFVHFGAAIAAIIFGKYLYGGLGNNPFNPAMVGFILAFFSFPAHFDKWQVIVYQSVDALSSPTPLSASKLNQTIYYFTPWFTIMSALGGLVLFVLNIISRSIVISFFVAAFACNFFLTQELDFLFYGGLVFAGFFVITDPVSAAKTFFGRCLYGGFIGVLSIWLRLYGKHTDGIAFAVLLGNIFAPLFDYFPLKWRR